MGVYERMLADQGFKAVAGVDEAGRGALAGPIVAAAVVLSPGFNLDGIDDSKKLSPKQRDAAYERIVSSCVWSVCRAQPGTIDKRGLHVCNIWLLRRAPMLLDPPPDYVLVDGFMPKGMVFPGLAMKKGDAVAGSVAAASIVAKVTRDRMLDRLHRRFPDFGFDHNRGYGTKQHLEALASLGPTVAHRLSFAGVGQPRFPDIELGLSRDDAIVRS